MSIAPSLIYALADIVFLILRVYFWIVILYAVMTWLVGFNVVNRHNRFVAAVGAVLFRLCEPPLRQIRRVIPAVGGIDFSPAVLLILLLFLQSFLARLLLGQAFG